MQCLGAAVVVAIVVSLLRIYLPQDRGLTFALGARSRFISLRALVFWIGLTFMLALILWCLK